jgi:hypothetical protein
MPMKLESVASGADIPTPCASTPGYECFSTASSNHAAVRVVDSKRIPIEIPPGSATGWGLQTLFRGSGGGKLDIIHIPPGAEGAMVHYHEFHEWAYSIAGDFSNNESTAPDQVFGPLQRYREGVFLSRPPYSLHGGERGRQKFMASQVGAVILIMKEGGATYSVDPDDRSGGPTSLGIPFNSDFETIQHWATPRIIDTLEKMPWQPVESCAGLNVKYLMEDPLHGFRATMWFLEAGAETPQSARPYYYQQAHQFVFLIAGDLKIQTYAQPGEPVEPFTLSQHFLVDRQPTSIFGLAGDGATQGGAVWLEVTYANGTRWSESPNPIEERHYIS